MKRQQLLQDVLKKLTLCVMSQVIIFNQYIYVHAADSEVFTFTGGVQSWTAPQSGKYRIDLYGATGGYSPEFTQYFEGVYPAEDATVRPQIPTGGHTYGYLNVVAGTTYYIQVGGQGQQSPSGQYGGGGWNGGGNGYGGSYGGGGATSMTTTNRGTIDNFKDHESEIIAVAGGGGGTGQNWKSYRSIDYTTIAGRCIGFDGDGIQSGYSEFYDHSIYVNSSSNVRGYSFGKGQDAYARWSNGGYGGGAGGGVYSGFASSHGILGGGGGSGANYKLYSANGVSNSEAGSGKVVLTYVGAVESHIVVDVGEGGTFNGQSGQIDYKGNFGNSFDLHNPVANSGYRFLGWQKVTTDQISDIHSPIQSGTVQFSDNTITYRAIWVAPLVLNAANVQDGRLQLQLVQNDMFNKVYRVMESYDGGTTWGFINATDSGFSTKSESGQFSANSQVQQMSAKVGYYTFNITGASGGAVSVYSVGLGGQSQGQYFNDVPRTIYICVGTHGNTNRLGPGYNGGGIGGEGQWNNSSGQCGDGGPGGGATSVALSSGTLSSLSGNRNSILLAAGGGGGPYGGLKAGMEGGSASGAGGGTTGEYYVYVRSTPGTQTSGGNAGGYFGQGGAGADGRPDTGQASEGNGGGGGGWYGGGGGPWGGDTGGSGGSGYVNASLLKNAQTSTPSTLRSKTRYNGSVSWTYHDQSSTMPQLTDVKYTDKAAPNIPADKGLTYVGSKIQVNWMHQGDNGTAVKYKAVQYDATNGQQLSESNIVDAFALSGVQQYKYILDTNPSTAINTNGSNGTQTTNTYIQVDGQSQVRYLHVAAVDGVGNIGPTCHIKIPSQITISYDKNSAQATGQMNPTVIEFGQAGNIQYNKFSWSMHRFVQWNTKPDGTGDTFKENQRVDYNYIVQKYGYGLTLYAQWEPLYTLTIDPNQGEWTDKGGVTVRNDLTSPGVVTAPSNITYKTPAQFLLGRGDSKTIFDAVRTGYNFTGWKFNSQKPVMSMYTVEYYFQNIYDDGYTRNDGLDVVKYQNSGVLVTASEEDKKRADTTDISSEFFGFDYSHCNDIVVDADGKQTLKIYYDREIWTISIYATPLNQSQTKGDINYQSDKIYKQIRGRYGSIISENILDIQQIQSNFEDQCPQDWKEQGYKFVGLIQPSQCVWSGESEDQHIKTYQFFEAREFQYEDIQGSRELSLYPYYADGVNVFHIKYYTQDLDNLNSYTLIRDRVITLNYQDATFNVTDNLEGFTIVGGQYRSKKSEDSWPIGQSGEPLYPNQTGPGTKNWPTGYWTDIVSKDTSTNLAKLPTLVLTDTELRFKRCKYNITYISDADTIDDMKVQGVYYEQSLGEYLSYVPQDEYSKGRTFLGWQLQLQDGQQDSTDILSASDTMPASNIYLHAVWKD